MESIVLTPEQNKVLNKYTREEIETYVSIGFCQPKFYTPSAWNKAKKLMTIAVAHNLAKPYNYGRGKGKYTTNLEIKDVYTALQKFIK